MNRANSPLLARVHTLRPTGKCELSPSQGTKEATRFKSGHPMIGGLKVLESLPYNHFLLKGLVCLCLIMEEEAGGNRYEHDRERLGTVQRLVKLLKLIRSWWRMEHRKFRLRGCPNKVLQFQVKHPVIRRLEEVKDLQYHPIVGGRKDMKHPPHRASVEQGLMSICHPMGKDTGRSRHGLVKERFTAQLLVQTLLQIVEDSLEAVASEEAGSECRLLPAEVMERLVSFFSDSIGTVRKCSSLLPRLSSLHGRRLTWMLLRLATLDMAALARVPRSIQVHRRELGRAMYGLALELCSYSQNTETPDTLFIQQLQIFAQLIQDIQCTWGAATSLPPHKNAIQVEANLAVSETARKHYGNAVDGLLWLTETLSAVQVAPLVEQHLRVLEALCNMRAVQVSRETASRQLIFHFQKLRGSRPLIDLGFLTPQDMTVLPVQYTCAELSRVVARGGGIFIPPQMNPGLAAMPPWTPSSGPHMQATDEFQGTSGSTEMHRKGSGSTELSETVTEQEAHAELSETVTEQEAHKARSGTPSTSLSPSASTRSQSGTPSASLSPSPRARRWSRQRHRNTQAKPSPGESPSAGP
ncbi:LOW QUALITY PROTEIN: uncharacterized protein EMH_0014060 [Eimeria mitis]|uniref:Uncharacterized protein n=1 Tax=Eimeria mitis TaxID=44415 RepID=U6K598_9EIME|nr:LOW QUALITY PROTEIN: uncharacterized protein EMH_0014060 [Eimeria mitis]CDJ32889.1 hypothetical protein, conserved [Eimeria mitis]